MAVGELQSVEEVGQQDALGRWLAFPGAGGCDLFDHGVAKLAPVRAAPETGDGLVVQVLEHVARLAAPAHEAHAAVDREIKRIAVPAEAFQCEVGAVRALQVEGGAVVDRVADEEGEDLVVVTRWGRRVGLVLAGRGGAGSGRGHFEPVRRRRLDDEGGQHEGHEAECAYCGGCLFESP